VSDPRFDDYNFFEGYSVLQATLLDTEDRLDKAEKRHKEARREMRAALLDSEQRVQKLAEKLSLRLRHGVSIPKLKKSTNSL
jgi:hypothetical protein